MVLKKKVLALVLVGAMVCGSSITAFADDITGATGAGTNTGHLDTDIYNIILPTSSVDGLFTFTIDPENILSKADKFTDNVALGENFEANDELVYFPQATTGAYDSTSQAVSIKAKNYIDADVSVAVTVADPAEGKEIIPLVEDEDALEAATEPSLFLQLIVGTKNGAITADGVTVSDTIAGQPTKFDTVYDSTNKVYKLQAQTTEGLVWNGVDVKLKGAVSPGTIATNIVAPTVSLTWSLTKHESAPTASATSIEGDAGTVDITLPAGITITAVEKVKADGTSYNAIPSANYSLTDITGGKKLTLIGLKTAFSAANKIKISFSSGDPIILDVE